MRILTLNCNGIRSACQKGFWDWMRRQKADIVCLQEIKCDEASLPDVCRAPCGFHAYFNPAQKPGYSGVALFSKKAPDRVVTGMAWPEMDHEGRYLQADFGNLSVVSLYLPSGSSSELRQTVKFQFLERFTGHLKQLRESGRELILCGDFNIAHREIDLRNWKANQKNSGFLPEERQWMDWLLGEAGFIDAFRAINQEPDQYTWWSQRGAAYEKNVGWRIDYHVVTPSFKERVQAVSIYKGVKFSDHAPLTIDYDYQL